MTSPNPIITRAWRDRTEAAARDNIAALADRGLTLTGPLQWVDQDGISIHVTVHGEGGVTIEVVDNPSPFKKWTIPSGWLGPA